ncbi:hypothetical protein ACO2I3_02860 [Leptospira interrogans]
MIYRKTGNLRAVQLLLGHSKIESTVQYLGIKLDDAIEIAEWSAPGAVPSSKLESGSDRPVSDLAEAERRAEQMLAARSFQAPAADSQTMRAV